MSDHNPPPGGVSRERRDRAEGSTDVEPDEEPWPIGFMLILLLAALYLGWRLVQGIAWVVEKI